MIVIWLIASTFGSAWSDERMCLLPKSVQPLKKYLVVDATHAREASSRTDGARGRGARRPAAHQKPMKKTMRAWTLVCWLLLLAGFSSSSWAGAGWDFGVCGCEHVERGEAMSVRMLGTPRRATGVCYNHV